MTPASQRMLAIVCIAAIVCAGVVSTQDVLRGPGQEGRAAGFLADSLAPLTPHDGIVIVATSLVVADDIHPPPAPALAVRASRAPPTA